MPTVTCKKCKAAIRWVFTENLKNMPLDFDPNPEGNVVETGKYHRGVAIVRVLGHPELDAPGTLYMPHHATCPNVDDFR